MPSPIPRDGGRHGGPLARTPERAAEHYAAVLAEARAEREAREAPLREARTARYVAADARLAEQRANDRLEQCKDHVAAMQEALADLWHAADEHPLPSVALQEALDNAERFIP